MKKYLIIILFFVLTLNLACDAYTNKITGNYYLSASGSKNNMSVCYKLSSGRMTEIVSNGVFAVGFNDYFIIVKQHPLVNYKKNESKLNRRITNYYIIPIAENTDENKIQKFILGPMIKSEYLKKRKELFFLDDFDFSIYIDDNE